MITIHPTSQTDGQHTIARPHFRAISYNCNTFKIKTKLNQICLNICWYNTSWHIL